MLVALFAGGVTATVILVIGVSLTLYRRNYSLPPSTLKVQTHVIHHHYDSSQPPPLPPPPPPSSNNKESAAAAARDVMMVNQKSLVELLTPEDDPDVIPSKTCERLPDIFEPDYMLDGGGEQQLLDYDDDVRIYRQSNAGSLMMDRAEQLSPQRPRTLPVHRTHDVYTRRLPVQESCI